MYSELIENNRLERIEDFVGLSLNKGLKEFKEFIHKTIRPYILS